MPKLRNNIEVCNMEMVKKISLPSINIMLCNAK